MHSYAIVPSHFIMLDLFDIEMMQHADKFPNKDAIGIMYGLQFIWCLSSLIKLRKFDTFTL